MNAMRWPESVSILDALTVLARWLLGGLFLYTGLVKALDPVEFLKLVREYHLVANPYLLNLIAASLPWLEVFCALLLLSGVAVRGTAMILLVMLVPFTLLVLQRALAIQSGLGIPFCSVRFNCGCGLGEVWICSKLAENAALILLTARGRQLSVRYGLQQ